MHSPSNGIRVLGIVCLVLAAGCSRLFPKPPRAAFLGLLRDQSGAAVAGADGSRHRCSARHHSNRGHRCLRRLRRPRIYSPAFTRFAPKQKASRPWSASNIAVEVAQDLRVDISLPTGQVSETVVVTDEVPLVNTHILHFGRHAEQRGDQRSAVEWPQLREPAAVAPRRDALSRRRILDDEHQRTARGRQRLLC